MKRLALIVFGFLAATSSFAQCTTFGNHTQCYDFNSGNNYSINRFGNITQMQGYNTRTGTNWSQQSNTIGNTTYQRGIDSQGNNWSQTINNNGSYTIAQPVIIQPRPQVKPFGCGSVNCF